MRHSRSRAELSDFDLTLEEKPGQFKFIKRRQQELDIGGLTANCEISLTATYPHKRTLTHNYFTHQLSSALNEYSHENYSYHTINLPYLYFYTMSWADRIWSYETRKAENVLVTKIRKLFIHTWLQTKDNHRLYGAPFPNVFLNSESPAFRSPCSPNKLSDNLQNGIEGVINMWFATVFNNEVATTYKSNFVPGSLTLLKELSKLDKMTIASIRKNIKGHEQLIGYGFYIKDL